MLMPALCFTAGAVLRLPSAQRRRHHSRCDDQDEQTDDDAAGDQGNDDRETRRRRFGVQVHPCDLYLEGPAADAVRIDSRGKR